MPSSVAICVSARSLSTARTQHVLADLLDAPRDPVAVERPHRVERLQHHQIERALEDVGLGLTHRYSCWTATGVQRLLQWIIG